MIKKCPYCRKSCMYCLKKDLDPEEMHPMYHECWDYHFWYDHLEKRKERMTELEFEEMTIPFIKKSFLFWSWQVPAWSRVIDFAGITPGGQSVGIEYKLQNWKKAIEQAFSHRLLYDFVYICMPKMYEGAIPDARKRGVGIIVFNGKPKVILKPRWNTMIWKPRYVENKKFIKHFQIHDRRDWDPDRMKELCKSYNRDVLGIKDN